MDADELKKNHRYFAVETNNLAWDLISRTALPETDAERMLAAAHASLFHWAAAGTAAHVARAEETVARAYASLGQGSLAVRYAEKYLASCRNGELADWDLAFAWSALARGHAALGDEAAFREAYGTAAEAGKEIIDPQDREIFEDDFRLEPWFGMVRPEPTGKGVVSQSRI